jgi:hypothetical protein
LAESLKNLISAVNAYLMSIFLKDIAPQGVVARNGSFEQETGGGRQLFDEFLKLSKYIQICDTTSSAFVKP